MERHKIKNIKKTIYYEYIVLNKYDINYHLVSIESDNFNCIIPSTYQIDYAQSNNNYDDKGHIYFYNDKYSYCLDYVKKDYDSFKLHMEHRKKNITKSFVNYKNQFFYELYDNNEYIYMYYEGYYFKIFTNHKMSINEYYDMYLILISMSKEKISKNIELLKELYYFNENGIYNICNDIDLINSNLNDYAKEISLDNDNIIVINDNDYLEYKSKQTKVETISRELLSTVMNNGESIDISYMFKFANLGKYNVVVNDYSEIVDSDELDNDEKNTLIEKMVQQKQNETYSNKDKINTSFHKYIIRYLKTNLSYSLWDVYHIREFINTDNFDNNISDEELYQLVMNDIDSALNTKLLDDSIKSHELNIYPTKYVLRLSLLNGLLNNLKIIFDEDYNLLDLNN